MADAIGQELNLAPKVAWRLALGLTQEQAARHYTERWPDHPRTNKHLSRWELWGPGRPNAERPPSAEDLWRLAQIYGCTVDDLLADSPAGPRSRQIRTAPDSRISSRPAMMMKPGPGAA